MAKKPTVITIRFDRKGKAHLGMTKSLYDTILNRLDFLTGLNLKPGAPESSELITLARIICYYESEKIGKNFQRR